MDWRIKPEAKATIVTALTHWPSPRLNQNDLLRGYRLRCHPKFYEFTKQKTVWLSAKLFLNI